MAGLSFRTSEESLRNAFQSFGQLIEVNLVMDKIANRPRGFAFLRYATKEESEKAIEGMHGKLEYFETILNQCFTSDASESLKSLQGDLLEKATECSSEASDTPSHRSCATRGSDDAPADDKQQGTISPDDLIALAQQCSSELLQSELERTRINTACFMESFPLVFAPESAKVAYASFRGSMDASNGSFMGTQAAVSRQRWR